MIILAADPGKSGAISWGRAEMRGNSHHMLECHVVDMPLRYDVTASGKEFHDTDEVAIFEILNRVRPDLAILEHVSPRPPRGPGHGGGVVQEWALACGYSALRSAFRVWFMTAGRPPSTHLVRPAIWKSGLGLTSDKEVSLVTAREEYPELADRLKRKKDEGRAEALLLLSYYRRILYFQDDFIVI